MPVTKQSNTVRPSDTVVSILDAVYHPGLTTDQIAKLMDILDVCLLSFLSPMQKQLAISMILSDESHDESNPVMHRLAAQYQVNKICKNLSN